MSIKSKVTQKLGKSSLKLKQSSPHILFGAGIVGIGVGTVLACRATLKVEKTLDEIKSDLDMVHNREVTEDYSHMDQRKDSAFVYCRSSWSLIKLYGPAVLVTGTSIAALTGSHVQLSRRNSTLTAAYAGLHQAYNDYRARVAAEIGEDKERDIHFAATTEKQNIDGKEKNVKTINPKDASIYARFFDEQSSAWVKDPEINRIFIQCQQNFANDLLRAKGYLFLNDVYEMLGLERSAAGQVVGWVMNGKGDNYVDFRIFEGYNNRFVNNLERSVLLDFNVDGPVLNYLEDN